MSLVVDFLTPTICTELLIATNPAQEGCQFSTIDSRPKDTKTKPAESHNKSCHKLGSAGREVSTWLLTVMFLLLLQKFLSAKTVAQPLVPQHEDSL